MENTIWSLVPIVFMFIMVLLTKRVVISFAVGIVAAALFIASFNISESISLIGTAFQRVFVVDGALNTGNVFILLFILMLGVFTAFVSIMGGTQAFGDWMKKRVRTRVGAQLMTMIFGIIIFVDDYFNSLTVGQVSKPVTDQHRISRAKLAYIVDTTSAPICVIAPISSWGAYIIGVLGTVLASHNISGHTAFGAFIEVIPMNFYVWAALGTVIVIAIKQTDFGPMKAHEKRARQTGEVANPENKAKVDTSSNLPVSESGKVWDLLVPTAVLFVATIGFIFWTGFRAADEKTIIQIVGEANIPLSLLWGGLVGLVVTGLFFLRHISKGKLAFRQMGKGLFEGMKSMLPAFFFLIFAWAMVFLIGELQTGVYLGGLVQQSHFSITLVPLIVFLMAGAMGFSSGDSWGTFGILVPIAGQIAATTDISLLLPMVAAVLAGGVFGDHCSPISDTTILSSAGSSCHHIDHVTTQIPYALVSAAMAGLGYLVFGLLGNVWMGLLTVVLALVVFFYVLPKRREEDKT